MKDTKRCPVLFSFYDRTGIQAYLEKQAEKGWMLDKTSAFGWRFHRIQPQKIHFSVVYFSKASVFDPEPSEGQRSYEQLCAHTGWKLAASNAQMQIFWSEAADPVPIETDAALEVAAIHASAKKSHLSAYWMLTAVGVLQAALFFWRFAADPIGVLGSNANLFSGLCWLLMLVLSLGELGGYYAWYRRAKAAAELDGSFVPTRGGRNLQLAVLGLMLLAFAFLLVAYGGSGMALIALVSVAAVLGVTAIVVGVSEGMKKLKLSATCNCSITIILTIVLSFAFTVLLLACVLARYQPLGSRAEPAATYEYNGRIFSVWHDQIPLTIEDLLEMEYDGYSYEERTREESLFLKQEEAVQRPRWDALEQPDLEYTVTTVKIPFFYEWCKKALLADFAHNYGRPEAEGPMWKAAVPVNGAPWGAKEAYQLRLGGEMKMHFLLCYDGCMVEIDFGWDAELTTEQMRTVGEKLGQER